jgi:hypothetical protein
MYSNFSGRKWNICCVLKRFINGAVKRKKNVGHVWLRKHSVEVPREEISMPLAIGWKNWMKSTWYVEVWGRANFLGKILRLDMKYLFEVSCFWESTFGLESLGSLKLSWTSSLSFSSGFNEALSSRFKQKNTLLQWLLRFLAKKSIGNFDPWFLKTVFSTLYSLQTRVAVQKMSPS